MNNYWFLISKNLVHSYFQFLILFLHSNIVNTPEVTHFLPPPPSRPQIHHSLSHHTPTLSLLLSRVTDLRIASPGRSAPPPPGHTRPQLSTGSQKQKLRRLSGPVRSFSRRRVFYRTGHVIPHRRHPAGAEPGPAAAAAAPVPALDFGAKSLVVEEEEAIFFESGRKTGHFWPTCGTLCVGVWTGGKFRTSLRVSEFGEREREKKWCKSYKH